MDWSMNNPNSKQNGQEVAQNILQIYVDSLQDHNKLRSLLSQCAVLDYFGKFVHGREEICTHLMANLYGSSFELSSLITDDEETSVEHNYLCCNVKGHQADEELGVNLISIPSSSFPSLSFTTHVGSNCVHSNTIRKSFGKRCQLNSSINCLIGKKCKLHSECSENTFTGGLPLRNLEWSPETFEKSELRYISSFGTIYYAKQVLSTTDPKRIKHHSIGTPRQRFCHLHINFECDEQFQSISNCKIWIIRYRMCSKMTPRNLLKSFTENDCCQSRGVSKE